MHNRRSVNVLNSVQRRVAIGRVCAYRTVSHDAVTVVAGLIPIDLMALERYVAFGVRRAAVATATDDEGPLPPGEPEPLYDPQMLRAEILAEWVRRWRGTDTPVDSGRGWTKLMIPPDLLVRWVTRKHGEMSFHLTQLMTGHGCFNRYLRKIDRATAAECSHCGPPDGYAGEVDDTHHTLVCCEAHVEQRARLDLAIGLIDPGGLVPKMLESPANWEAFTRFSREVMTRQAVPAG